MCQKYVRPSVQKRWRTMAFSRISTGESVIPSSCEMKYEPSLKPQQGNPAFYWGRASRGPFHLRQKTQSPSHIHISEGRLPWAACGKLAYHFVRRQWIILIWRCYGLHGTFLKLLYWNWRSSILETIVSGNLSRFLKGVKPLVLCDVDRGLFMEPTQGKWASFQFDFGYTEQFCIPGVTSVFSSCFSAVGDSLEFNQSNRGSLRVWLGKHNCSGHNAGESGLISRRGGSLMGFLELRQEPVVYSRVTAGMSI